MKLKELPDGQEMPKDFWNYLVNPILGYKYKEPRKIQKETNKYGLTPISTKQ